MRALFHLTQFTLFIPERTWETTSLHQVQFNLSGVILLSLQLTGVSHSTIIKTNWMVGTSQYPPMFSGSRPEGSNTLQVLKEDLQ